MRDPLQSRPLNTSVELVGCMLIRINTVQPRPCLRRGMRDLWLKKLVHLKLVEYHAFPLGFLGPISAPRAGGRSQAVPVLRTSHPIEISCQEREGDIGRKKNISEPPTNSFSEAPRRAREVGQRLKKPPVPLQNLRAGREVHRDHVEVTQRAAEA